MKFKVEQDLLGKKKIPSNAYYGIFTARALENFQVSNLRFDIELIKALAYVKVAAAKTNMRLKLLDKKKGNAIIKAANDVLKGKFDNEFNLDIFQAGAGTSTNMNINEVIAKRASEILKAKKNDDFVHPNDHVNLSQSSNDAFPSALRVACLKLLPKLINNLTSLQKSLYKKSKQFNKILKSGRTHLRDAVPITLGQEFHAYSVSIKDNIMNIKNALNSLSQINMGGTAIGTGFNTHPAYKSLVIKNLKQITKLNLSYKEDLIEATQNSRDFLEVSGLLRLLAVDLIRIANDIRLLSSGPGTGLNEIILPTVQPGSSIMPGKVNPSIAEALNMVCFHVVGNDLAILMACQAGQLELNVMTPVIAYNLLQSIGIMSNGANMFDKKCIRGIKSNKAACNYYLLHSLGIATALTPYLGYDKVAEMVEESLIRNKPVIDIVKEKNLLSKKQLRRIFNYRYLTSPNLK